MSTQLTLWMLLLVIYFLQCFFFNLFYNFPFLTVKQYHNFDLSANVETPCTTHGVHVFQTAFKFMQLPCSIFLCLPLVYSIQKKNCQIEWGSQHKIFSNNFLFGVRFSLCAEMSNISPLCHGSVCLFLFPLFTEHDFGAGVMCAVCVCVCFCKFLIWMFFSSYDIVSFYLWLSCPVWTWVVRESNLNSVHLFVFLKQ